MKKKFIVLVTYSENEIKSFDYSKKSFAVLKIIRSRALGYPCVLNEIKKNRYGYDSWFQIM